MLPETLTAGFKVYPTVRKVRLFKQVKEDRVKCLLCERGCIISPFKRGFCETRANIEGCLYTLVYGDLSALESRPIEIKPLFHYWPGSSALTFSTWSCNFRCPWCQNHLLSRGTPNPTIAKYVSPEEVVNRAIRSGDQGLCVSFTEPTTLFEYACDAFKLARQKGLYNCFVSNGYLTSRALNELVESGMSGIKIDVKGDSQVYQEYCSGIDVEKVWRTAREAKKMGLHVEIVHLVVSGLNDSRKSVEKLIEKHLDEVGEETPLHFTRYFPAYKWHSPPTKVEFLEEAYEIAKNKGILYPYLGNVPGHKHENTYCPKCKRLLVERSAYKIVEYLITPFNECPFCGENIPIVGKYISSKDKH